MATILGESPSYRFNIRRNAEQDQQLRSQEKPFLNPGSGYNRDTFPMPFANIDAGTQYKMSESGQQDLLNKKKLNQRNQGGVGATNGATTGSAVNSGTGVQEISKPTLGETPVIAAPTKYTSRFEQPAADTDVVTRTDGSMSYLGDVNQERADRSAVVSDNTRIGGGNVPNSLDETNTNPRPSGAGAFSTYTPPDYEASIAALKDLREAKIETAGGRGNRGTGPSIEELQNPSYSQALAAYSSGDVGSDAYNMIRNQRMNEESAIDDQMREIRRAGDRVGSKRGRAALYEQAAQVGADMRKGYTEQDKARLGLESDQAAARADMAKADMANLSEQAKLRLSQNKQLMDQLNSDRQFGLESDRFGLESEKATADRQYKLGQLGLDEARISQSQAELGLKAGDYASQAEKRRADIMLGQLEGLRKAYETGQEPIKNAASIMKQEGGLASLPAAARVQLLRLLDFDPALIDPEGWAEVQQQQTGQ